MCNKRENQQEIEKCGDYGTAMREMINGIESAAYDLLKTCGIYGRVPADHVNALVLSDCTDEVDNSVKNIMDAIIQASSINEQFTHTSQPETALNPLLIKGY